MQKIIPFLWFDDQAEEAANYYVSVFSNSKIIRVQSYPKSAEEVSGKKAGTVMTVDFELDGVRFQVLNGGTPEGFTFSPATSFVVNCETQEEIDHFWEKLSADPKAEQCGWCKDKFGVTWQIVPTILDKFMTDSDQAKVEKVTAAFINMKKFDIIELQKAYDAA